MYTEKIGLEDESRRRAAGEKMDNCFMPCAYSEHQAYVDAIVEDEVVQKLLALVRRISFARMMYQ